METKSAAIRAEYEDRVAAEKMQATTPVASAPYETATPYETITAVDEAPPKVASTRSGDSPSQLFEKVMAPIFVPDAIKRKRPELLKEIEQREATKKEAAKAKAALAKDKLEAAKVVAAEKAEAAKAAAAEKAAIKAAADAEKVEKAAAAKASAAANAAAAKKRAAEAATEKAAPKNLFGVKANTFKTPERAAKAAKASTKRAAKKAASAPSGDSPSQLFEKVLAPIYVPDSIKRQREAAAAAAAPKKKVAKSPFDFFSK